VAKVSSPLGGERASGSVAGRTYGRWRNYNVVRSRSKPVNPSTAAQTSVRNRLADLVQAWSLLSPEQQQYWRDYATEHSYPNKFVGGGANLPGYNAFLSTVGHRLAHGFAPGAGGAMALPTTEAPALVAEEWSVGGASGLLVEWDAGALNPGDNVQVWVAGPHSRSRRPLYANAKLGGLITTGGGGGNLSIPGAPNQWYSAWVRAMRITDQMPSPPLYIGRAQLEP
jgi:hypothetical protein